MVKNYPLLTSSHGCHNKREKHAKENGMSKEEIEKEIYELKERFNIVKMRLEREYQR